MGAMLDWLAVPRRWERALYGPPYEYAEMVQNRWILRTVTPETVVLDVGAGPPTPYFPLDLRGRAKRVIGADVDPAVLRNWRLDEAHVTDGGRLPLEDESVDLAISTYVLEHVAEPEGHFHEIARVLRPGGSFFFLTVNAWHPTVAAYRLVPRALKDRIVATFGKRDAEGENYPVYFRANTEAAIRRLACASGFGGVEIRHREHPPHYFRGFLPLWIPGVVYEHVVRKCRVLGPVKSALYGRLEKGGRGAKKVC